MYVKYKGADVTLQTSISYLRLFFYVAPFTNNNI